MIRNKLKNYQNFFLETVSLEKIDDTKLKFLFLLKIILIESFFSLIGLLFAELIRNLVNLNPGENLNSI